MLEDINRCEEMDSRGAGHYFNESPEKHLTQHSYLDSLKLMSRSPFCVYRNKITSEMHFCYEWL